MLKIVFPLSYKYSTKYRVIASLMAPPSFVLCLYTISFIGAFTGMEPCPYKLELVSFLGKVEENKA